MNLKEAYYTYVGGIRKNSKLAYWIHSLSLVAAPLSWCRWQRKRVLRQYEAMSEEEKRYVDERVEYYCRTSLRDAEAAQLPTLADNNLVKKHRNYTSELARRKGRLAGPSTYFFDSYEYTRCYPQSLHWNIEGGDVNTEMPLPTITKSRPVGSQNNVLLNLDKCRHFLFFNDPFAWEEKQTMVLFRGVVLGKKNRQRFMDMWKDHPLCDLKDTGRMSLYAHLRYRYIMSLEGNDVASNLKWVMSSNSIAVMPKPTCESWYMEAKLIGGYHYIEIASDYHDLIEKIEYYDAHPDEANAIIQHAHDWVAQFRNDNRERIIAIKVLDKYLNYGVINNTNP